jgi:phospholipid/cholesterol/gamma-HCH transport system substrate-binding protein
MEKETSKNIRLGLLVTIGTVFLIIAMYLIGDKQNLFGSTSRITATFRNVNGLAIGNNVRFGGINVGTVESIEIANDTTISVVMLIQNEAMQHIKKNALASIGTDGLMGNKLININSAETSAEPIEDGDKIKSMKPIETDEMLRTLNRTNEDIAVIVKNLKLITSKVNSPNSLWSILMDTVIANNLKQAVVNVKLTSSRSAIVVGDLSSIVKDVKAGKGSVGALLTDTTFASDMKQTIVNIRIVSDSLAYLTGDFRKIADKINKGDGAIGTLLTDTTFVHNLNQSMINIKKGSKGFDESMEAAKRSILLRSYFKKKEKKEKESKKKKEETK